MHDEASGYTLSGYISWLSSLSGRYSVNTSMFQSQHVSKTIQKKEKETCKKCCTEHFMYYYEIHAMHECCLTS